VRKVSKCTLVLMSLNEMFSLSVNISFFIKNIYFIYSYMFINVCLCISLHLGITLTYTNLCIISGQFEELS
jgi:hypothetical protein